MKRMQAALTGLLAAAVLAAAVFLPQYALHVREKALYGQLETRANAGLDFRPDGATLLQRIQAAGTLEISTLDFQVGASLYGGRESLLAQFQTELETLAGQMEEAQIILDQLNMAIAAQKRGDAADYWESMELSLELNYDCVVDAATGRIYILGFLRGGAEAWFELRMDMLSQKIISIRCMAEDIGEAWDWDVYAEQLAEYLGLQYDGFVSIYPDGTGICEFSDEAQDTVCYVLNFSEANVEFTYGTVEIYPGTSQDCDELGYDAAAD